MTDLSREVLDAMRELGPLDHERLDWHREHMTPAKWRALEAVCDGRVIVRSVVDESAAKYGIRNARYCVPETARGRLVRRAALIDLWPACWGWGRQVEPNVFEAFLRPVGRVLLAERSAFLSQHGGEG